MIDHVEAPEIYVYSPDRRKNYGVLRNLEEFTEDVRFNTCSEVQLKVANKICDPLTGEWIENPVYENLEKNNLLFLCDDNEYFSFPNRTLRDDYRAKTYGWLPYNYGRRTDNGYVSMTYENTKDTGNDDGVLVGFALQPETLLHNISVVGGFQWTNLAEIQSNGSLVRSPSNWYSNCNNVACHDYIHIEPYDVLSFRSQYYKGATGNNIRYKLYTVMFYTANDANTCLGYLTLKTDSNATTRINPVKRFSINSLTSSDDITYNLQNSDVYPNYQNMSTQQKFDALKNALSNGGYIRIDAVDNEKKTQDTLTTQSQVNDYKSYSSYYYTYDGLIHMGWSFPYNGWVNLYSGQRFCSQIDNDITEGSYGLPLHWFVITDIDEDYDGNMSFKTVTAYSYEYTLNNRCISLSEDTLPFYIPDKIIEAVNNSEWIVDKEYGNYNTTASRGAQCLKSGILNQILELLPEWRVGHISSKLMTRYRTVGDVDNSHLYSFCMNDIETLYQCYFVFDCDNRTISAYTQEDIINNSNSNIILNWQNALKSLKIKDQDKNFITALRVHTADDTYGIGLVNPTGNAFIYNFNSVLDKMDFVADTSDNDPLSRNKITENGVTRNRTLKEAVIALQNFLATPNVTVNGVTINSLSGFRNYAQKFVEANLNLIKSESALQMYISDYKSIVNQIAVAAEYAGQSTYYQYENVETEDTLYNHKIYHHFDEQETVNGQVIYHSGFINDNLFGSLQSASKKYYEAKDEYDTYVSNYNTYLNILKGVAKKTNLNYYNQKKLTTAYASDNTIVLSLLTPAEILALQPFIREGDWTNDNSVFSEDYDAKDIISTLISAFDQAKSDMDTFLSKPSYDFESDVVNWITIPEMRQNYKKLKVGKTLYINSIDDEYVVPMLLELHINYFDKDDFFMTFTTNYKRKVTELRFYDLYSEVNRISATDSTFTFNE